MTIRKLVLSVHAVDDLTDHNVKRWQVRITMEAGRECEAVTHTGAETRFSRCATFGRKTLKVVFLRRPDHDLVISNHWINRPTKRRRLEGKKK
jgi:hypothetical protein